LFGKSESIVISDCQQNNDYNIANWWWR